MLTSTSLGDNLALALGDVNQAIALDPDLAIAHHNKGLVLVAAESDERALLSFSKAIELDPSLGDAYYNRAQVHVNAGDTARAVADLEQVLALTENEALVEAARQLLSLVQ